MTIMDMKVSQEGKSTIGNLVVIALVVFGIWFGIQFIPQKIEQGSVRSMLDRVEQRHFNARFQGEGDLWGVIDRQLDVNEMRDMRKNIDVSRVGNGYAVRVSYERELNLIFTTRKIIYNESILLE